MSIEEICLKYALENKTSKVDLTGWKILGCKYHDVKSEKFAFNWDIYSRETLFQTTEDGWMFEFNLYVNVIPQLDLTLVFIDKDFPRYKDVIYEQLSGFIEDCEECFWSEVKGLDFGWGNITHVNYDGPPLGGNFIGYCDTSTTTTSPVYAPYIPITTGTIGNYDLNSITSTTAPYGKVFYMDYPDLSGGNLN